MSKTELSRRRRWLVIYCLSAAAFLALVGNFYRPRYGFTTLIEFGDQFNGRSIAALDCFMEQKSAGYDGQFYAKLALDPLILHPADDKVDNLYYRGRRIFLSWTAWALGLGRPVWIMRVFALQNVVCWFALAWVLTRWFPPLDFNNYARWAGILFSFGLMASVRASLTDGPSFLLVALGLAFCEANRRTWAAGMLAVAGLTRETSLLAFAALVDPARRSLRDLGRLALLGALSFGPLLGWMIYLKLHLENSASAAGIQNLDVPFAGWAQKWGEIFPLLGKNPWARQTFFVLIAMTAQAFFLFARPAFSKPAWRMGVAFAALMFCLGGAVWGGLPPAAARAVLPMLLAFNLLVPRGRWWLALLVAGNLSVAVQPLIELRLLGEAGVVNVSDPAPGPDGREWSLAFGPEWYHNEQGIFQTARRWSPGTASVAIYNPLTNAVQSGLTMELSAKRNDTRAMSVELNGREVWAGTLTEKLSLVRLESVRLEPGENTLVFKTAGVPSAADGGRSLAFCLRNLRVDVQPAAKP